MSLLIENLEECEFLAIISPIELKKTEDLRKLKPNKIKDCSPPCCRWLMGC